MKTLEQLYESYNGVVRSVAHRYTKNQSNYHDNKEEIASLTWERIVETYSSWGYIANEKQWIVTIANNVARSFFRKQQTIERDIGRAVKALGNVYTEYPDDRLGRPLAYQATVEDHVARDEVAVEIPKFLLWLDEQGYSLTQVNILLDDVAGRTGAQDRARYGYGPDNRGKVAFWHARQRMKDAVRKYRAEVLT